MKRISWFFLALVKLVFNLLTLLLVNWWVVFFAVPVKDSSWMGTTDNGKWRGLERLPSWLSWFETFDASLDAGWADGYFAEEGTYTAEAPPSFWKRKYYQWRWLNRNTAYSFSYYPLGIVVDPAKWAVKTCQYNPETKALLFYAVSSAGHWNFRYRGKFGSANLGWKAWNYWDEQNNTWKTKPWGPYWRTQIVLSINPFKRA